MQVGPKCPNLSRSAPEMDVEIKQIITNHLKQTPKYYPKKDLRGIYKTHEMFQCGCLLCRCCLSSGMNAGVSHILESKNIALQAFRAASS